MTLLAEARQPSGRRGAAVPYLVVRRYDEATRPGTHIFGFQYYSHTFEQSPAGRNPQPHQEQAVMRTRGESSHIRKIEVLRYGKTSFLLRGLPHREVTRASKTFLRDGFDVMAVHGQH